MHKVMNLIIACIRGGGCCVTLKAGNAKVKVIRRYEQNNSDVSFGSGGQRGRVMNRHGILPAISATDYKDPQKTIRKVKNEKSDCAWWYRQDRTRES